MAKKFICSYSEPIVDTPCGKIRGYFYNGTYIFQGIKYANAKRFQMPTKVEPWEGVKDALGYGYTCPTLREERCGPEVKVPHRYWPKDEACQYLNIWTQSIEKGVKKPVLLWLHGGGFADCSAIELACTDGTALSREGDVVMVSLNHRLNILGFLDVSAYGEKYANSGNVGMADIVMALEWIRDNIADFGGDPDNVTIFGQSGGGGKVCALLQIPAADGLFHKAIVHSGIHVRRARPSAEVSKVLVGEMLKVLDIAPEEIEKLEEVPYSELVRAYNEVVPGLKAQGLAVDGWAPLNNGYYQGYARLDGFYEHALKVPTIIGTCYAEFSRHSELYRKHELSEEEIMVYVREKYGDYADEIAKEFKKAYPEKNLMDVLVLDSNTRNGSLDHVTKRAQFEGAAPVYTYVFAHEFDVDNGTPAWHCAELPYFFHNTDMIPVCQKEGVEQLEAEMAGVMIAFAYTGNPNHEGMAYWPAFDMETKSTMVFGESSGDVREDFDRELIELTQKLSPPFMV